VIYFWILAAILALGGFYVFSRFRNIHVMARIGSVARVQALLDGNPDLIRSLNSRGETPLHSAAAYGEKDVLKLLVDRGGDIDAVSSEGITALHLAAGFGELETVRLLVSKGAQVGVKDKSGITPLLAAKMMNHKPVEELLLKSGAVDEVAPAFIRAQDGHLVVPIAADDPLMADARRAAAASWPALTQLFREHPQSTAVKITAPGGEKIWAGLLELAGDKARVRIKTAPLAGAAPAGPIDVAVRTIEDWMVTLPDGRIRGGYSFKALMQRTQERLGRVPPEMEKEKARFLDH
jgi:hypothetical protein